MAADLPALVAALRTPPSEEDWRGVMREHTVACLDAQTDYPGPQDRRPCWCGATDHNARLSALRAKVEAERERTRRVVEAAVRYQRAVDGVPVVRHGADVLVFDPAEMEKANNALLDAARALRGEP